MAGSIVVRGAREHNLKNVDVEIPRDRLVVITGLSGSGKSSLAFDTLYAEGQRRYVESLSAYARQFLEQMEKPDVDSIEGLSPAIAIEQKGVGRNPRSTVGTVTEIYDYLRLLFARVGKPVLLPVRARRSRPQTVQQIVDRLLALPAGHAACTCSRRSCATARASTARSWTSCAGGLRARARRRRAARAGGGHRRCAQASSTPSRCWSTGWSSAPASSAAGRLARGRVPHGDEVVRSRSPRRGGDGRERGALQPALRLPDLRRVVSGADAALVLLQQPVRRVPARAAASACTTTSIPALVVPDESLSLAEGAIAPWGRSARGHYRQRGARRAGARTSGSTCDTPFAELPRRRRARDPLRHGRRGDRLRLRASGRHRHEFTRRFEGVIPLLERRHKETESDWLREELERFMSARPCPTCEGTRLRPEAAGRARRRPDDRRGVARSRSREARRFFAELALGAQEQEIARRDPEGDRAPASGFLVERRPRLPDARPRRRRRSPAARAQRIRLATQIGSSLSGVLYVLDEPSIGLHQRDNARLLATLAALRDLGNTVIVVEHDRDTILAADHVIDMGPGAGVHGGTSSPRARRREIMANPASLTGRYLSRRRAIPVPARASPRHRLERSRVRGARANNLRDVDRRDPARHDDLRHRRLRLGQEHARRSTRSTARSRSGSRGARRARASTTSSTAGSSSTR